MNKSTASAILNATFSGISSKGEELNLELMLEVTSNDTVGRRIVLDLLTNDFDLPNAGYLISNLAENVYGGNEIIVLAKLWDKVCSRELTKKARPVAKRLAGEMFAKFA
jgi:uncharacterized protein (DUF2344 family)